MFSRVAPSLRSTLRLQGQAIRQASTATAEKKAVEGAQKVGEGAKEGAQAAADKAKAVAGPYLDKAQQLAGSLQTTVGNSLGGE